MSTISTLNNWETGSSIRTKINDNFTALNTDKAEKSGATFTWDISVPDEAYGTGWNGSLEVPTKNAVYDKIETKQDTLVSWTNIKTVNGNSLLGSGDIAISGGGGVTDHWALTGLADDDHTQYTKADGTRAFTGKVSYSSHPTFSADTELVDKKYVDDSITAGGGYTDEQAQDAVGTILVDSARIDFTYNDWTPSITADIIDDSVTFTKIQNIHTNRILGRSSSGSGDIEELNVTAVPALIGLWNVDNTSDATKNSATATLTNKTITKPTIQGSVQNIQTISATVGGTTTLDCSIYNWFIVNLWGSTTIAITNAVAWQHFWIQYVQDATGGRTVTQFSTIRWAWGTAPTLTTTANKKDWVGHLCTSTGNYDGVLIAQNI
jgi:hypothetical protein